MKTEHILPVTAQVIVKTEAAFHPERVCMTCERDGASVCSCPATDLYEALVGMMRHSCVADSAPEDKDDEDHIAESAAMRALAKARGAA